MSRSVTSDYGVLPLRGILRKKKVTDGEQKSICAQSDSALLKHTRVKPQSDETRAKVRRSSLSFTVLIPWQFEGPLRL